MNRMRNVFLSSVSVCQQTTFTFLCISREGTVAYGNGGVPPFGHSTQLRVFVDPDLLQYDEVWAAAGTWNDNFGAAPADIVLVAGGVVTDLKRA